MTIWRRAEVDVSRVRKQELLERETHLGRKEDFSSALVLVSAVSAEPAADGISVQEGFWESFGTDRFTVIFLLQRSRALELVCT